MSGAYVDVKNLDDGVYNEMLQASVELSKHISGKIENEHPITEEELRFLRAFQSYARDISDNVKEVGEK